jgi:MOSC domain-containing protein YiiM
MPRLAQLNISPGGMPKLPIPSALVTAAGVAGDWQLNRKYHGGPDRAVCLFSLELYDQLRQDGIDLPPGSVGENFTTIGIDLNTLSPGDRLQIGGCLIEITKVRVPCRSLDQWDKRLLSLLKNRSGWVARVLVNGMVQTGDRIEIVVPASKNGTLFDP